MSAHRSCEFPGSGRCQVCDEGLCPTRILDLDTAGMPAAKRRSRGVVRRLLEHMLRADADGVGVWLEVTDSRNVPLYERFGFTTAHTPPSGDDAARGG